MAADVPKKADPSLAPLGPQPPRRDWEDAESAHLAQQMADQAEALLHNITRRAALCPAGTPMTTYLGIPPSGLAVLEQGGVIFYRQKDFVRARKLFRLVLGLSALMGQPRPTALRGLAACDHSQNQLSEAIDLYRQALVLDPHDAISLSALANCLALAGDRTWQPAQASAPGPAKN